MSSPLDKREKAQEAKFVLDADIAFRVNARRNKLLGLWAAAEIGLLGDEAEAFAQQVVLADFEEPGQEDVVRKIVTDLKTAGAGISEADVRRKMEDLLSIARDQIESGGN